jgi:hypothetical protein
MRGIQGMWRIMGAEIRLEDDLAGVKKRRIS